MKNNLRSIRKQKKLTLKDLSVKTGLSIGLIGNFETGQRGISDEALGKVAAALAVSVAEILQSSSSACPPRAVPAGCPRCAILEAELHDARAVISNLATALAAKPIESARHVCGALDSKTKKERRGV